MLGGWEQKQKDGRNDPCGVEERSQQNVRTQIPMEISTNQLALRGLEGECYILTFNYHSTKSL